MTPVRLEPATLRSRVKHSTTEPLRSLRTHVCVGGGGGCVCAGGGGISKNARPNEAHSGVGVGGGGVLRYLDPCR